MNRWYRTPGDMYGLGVMMVELWYQQYDIFLERKQDSLKEWMSIPDPGKTHTFVILYVSVVRWSEANHAEACRPSMNAFSSPFSLFEHNTCIRISGCVSIKCDLNQAEIYSDLRNEAIKSTNENFNLPPFLENKMLPLTLRDQGNSQFLFLKNLKVPYSVLSPHSLHCSVQQNDDFQHHLYALSK